MRRRRDEELYGAFDEQEDELSLEAILAEYGKGGRQPVLEEPSEGPPSQPEPVPEPESIPEPEPVQKEERVPGPEYESPAPDRVALKDIMSQTVDAVLEDEDDGVIAQPVPLRERLAAVLERFTVRQRSRSAVRLFRTPSSCSTSRRRNRSRRNRRSRSPCRRTCCGRPSAGAADYAAD